MSEYIINDRQLGLIQDFATVCVEGEKLPRIVRCRSCVYFASNQPETGWCAKFGANTEQDGGDGFCAWGERRGK